MQPAADTTLIEAAPQNNLGGATFFNAGTTGSGKRNRALLFYDLSSAIPPGAVITGAELSMDVVRAPGGNPRSSIFSLRRMFRSWGEGGQTPADPGSPGQGAPAAAGEATWENRFAPGTAWGALGGEQGTDFSDTISSSAFVGGAGQTILFGSTPASVADVQFWLDHPQANFGWMLQTESEELGKTARGFASRESGFGPTLAVTFTAVPEPGTISLVSLFLICLGVMARRRR